MAKPKGLRAVSQYRNYGGPTAQDERKMVLATGQEQVLQKYLMAEPWVWNNLTPWERECALNHFTKMRGLTHDEDPVLRFSVFDSIYAQRVNGWTDEEREIVENAVRNGPGVGQDYIIVDQQLVPAPWPSYDKLKAVGKRTVEMVAEKIAETTAELGIDPQHVLAYERENEDRPAVIAAVGALLGPQPAAEELIEA